MQATTAVGAGSRGGKLAAALVLAAGILAGAAGGAGAGSNARQLEPLAECGGAVAAGADRLLLAPQTKARNGAMGGGRYVGVLPE